MIAVLEKIVGNNVLAHGKSFYIFGKQIYPLKHWRLFSKTTRLISNSTTLSPRKTSCGSRWTDQSCRATQTEKKQLVIAANR